MKSLANCIPCLPGLPAAPTTYARHKVWRDSTTQPVRPQPLIPRREAGKVYRRAKRFERRTRKPGRQDGELGRNGLAVLHTLLFDFMSYRSGRLDPSYEALARAACISRSSAWRGLASCKAAGVLDWVRRCREGHDEDGRYERRQETNVYTISTKWHGFQEPEPDPVIEPWQIGATPPLPDPIEAAVAAHFAGASPDAVVAHYRTDPHDKLALAWAGLLGALSEKP